MSSFFSMPNLLDHWTDLNQTWTHIHTYNCYFKIRSELFRALTPTGWGWRLAKNAFWVRLRTLTEHISATEHDQQSERDLSIYSDSPTCPQIWWTLVQKRLRTVGEFCPTPKFSHWETLPALPHGRYITGSRVLACSSQLIAWLEIQVNPYR